MQLKVVGNFGSLVRFGSVVRRVGLTLGGALFVGAMTGPAYAGGPLPYDAPAPPPNISVAFMYNIFSSASSFYTSNGTKVGNTRIQTDVPVFRFVHTFNRVDGMAWGVQFIQPYVGFVGNQQVNGFGLSHNSGFAEPTLSAFIYPISHPKQDESLVFTYYLSPPIGSYNSSVALNGSTNNWVNNFEVGYTHKVFGKPGGKRFDLQLWADAYFYSNDEVNGYTLKANPEAQFIVYAPYYFYPPKDSYVGLSFEKTFGGQLKVSSGGATGPEPVALLAANGGESNFTRIGVIAGSFLAPTIFGEAELSSDVQTRGGARNDVQFLVQVAKIF